MPILIDLVPIRIPKEHHYNKVEIQPISIDDIENAARESKQIVKNNLELEIQLVRKGKERKKERKKHLKFSLLQFNFLNFLRINSNPKFNEGLSSS